MRTPAIQNVVFDLGRVLVDFCFVEFTSFLVSHGAKLTSVDDFKERSQIIAYEHGHITNDQFFENILSLLSTPVAKSEIRARWLALFTPIHSMLQLAERLTTTHRVFVLSNTSELLWEHFHAHPDYQLGRRAHGLLASFEIGVMKPDPRIYREAERRFELDPSRSVFIDDIEENIQAAKDRGWQGIIHKNPEMTVAALTALQVSIPEEILPAAK